MKINAIKAACMSAGEIVIYNAENGEQWLGTRAALYPVDGIHVTAANVCALMDINAKKAAETYITEVYTDDARLMRENFPDQCYYKLLYTEVIDQYVRYGVLQPAQTQRSCDGIIMFPLAELRPVTSRIHECEFYLRDFRTDNPRNRQPALIAVYADMLCGALIAPIRDIDARAIMQRLAQIGNSDAAFANTMSERVCGLVSGYIPPANEEIAAREEESERAQHMEDLLHET